MIDSCVSPTYTNYKEESNYDNKPVIVQYNSCPPLLPEKRAYSCEISSKIVNKLFGAYDSHYVYNIELSLKNTSSSVISINDRYSNFWNVVNALRTIHPAIILPFFPEKGDVKLSNIDKQTLELRMKVLQKFFPKIAENNLLVPDKVYQLFMNPKLPDDLVKKIKAQNEEWEKFSKEKENHLQALLENYKDINEDYAIMCELEKKLTKLGSYLTMRSKRSRAFKNLFATFEKGFSEIGEKGSARKPSLDDDTANDQQILADLNPNSTQTVVTEEPKVAIQYEYESPEFNEIEIIVEEVANEARNFLKFFQIGFQKIVRHRSIKLPGEGFIVPEPMYSEAFTWPDLTEAQRSELKISKQIITYENASKSDQKVFTELSDVEKRTIDILEFQLKSFLKNIVINFKYILERMANLKMAEKENKD